MADQARTIRLPAHIAEAISKLARGQRQMLQDLGREPTPNESAAELDMTAESDPCRFDRGIHTEMPWTIGAISSCTRAVRPGGR
jgi:hypothetical protein